ncbi:MAG: aminotransferase class I/II-fold pyridoxal phosphate-dependent enzyme [Candidatus Omnitrophica bacterium]|nr:aminotransferase class I/II-fold pyridoxal phosphate-dependent enzyme [Candidatus Omnitrophota bacterium]
MCKEIFLDAPNIGELEKKYVNQALETGYVSTAGPFVGQFEDKFSQYLGMVRAVSTQSGTAAIHMALHELCIGSGDEVIVPALTFVATVNPVEYVGAKPVFVDVDSDSWNMDPDQIEKNITEKTKAVIPVHLYGNPCDMGRIMEIADKYGIYVIEDATESLGGKYKGKLTGTIGHFGCFSFNGNKTITTGGGGMVVSCDREKMEHIKFLVNQARDGNEGYFHSEIGFNYRMTNLEAALGLAQMERAEELISRKRQLNEVYREELNGVEEIMFQSECEGAESSWWLTCVCLKEGADLPVLRDGLAGKGIHTRKLFTPLTEFPPYEKYARGRHGNSHRLYERGLCLPSSTLNTAGDVKHVCDEIKKILSGKREKINTKR